MELKGDFTFDAPQSYVWEALNDPNVLGSVMPGSQGFEELEPNKYKGQLKVKVGPVQGIFDAEINLVDVKEPDSYTMEVDGKGNVGYVNANGGIQLSPIEDDKTSMVYEGTAQVSGRIASVGQRLMLSTARSIVRQSLTALNEYLKIQVANDNATVPEPADTVSDAPVQERPAPQAVPTSNYQPPSEIEVGMEVAKDVFEDMVPEKYRPVVIVAALGFFLYLFRKIFS